MKTKSIAFIGLVLATILLPSMFFVTITVSEFPPEQPGEYSAWADLNDDGEVDIYDIVWMAGRYGTTGIPSKNVNVTNWPEAWLTGTINVTNFPDREPMTIVVCENYTINGTGEKIALPFVVNVEGYSHCSLFYSYSLQPYSSVETVMFICPKVLDIKPRNGPYWDTHLWTTEGWVDSAYCALPAYFPEIWFIVQTANQTTLSLTMIAYCYD